MAPRKEALQHAAELATDAENLLSSAEVYHADTVALAKAVLAQVWLKLGEEGVIPMVIDDPEPTV